MKQPHTVFAGHVCIDHNTVEHATYVNWGSPALYMTRHLQETYGVDPAIIATYGADFLEYTQEFRLFPRTPDNDSPTLAYENIVKAGVRTQYCHHSGTAAPKAHTARATKDLLSNADLFFLTPLTPAYTPEYVADLVANTPAHCLRVLLPQGYLRHIGADGLVQPREFQEARAVLPHFGLVILSDEDQPQAIATMYQWQQLSPDTTFVVTQNSKGAAVIRGDTTTFVPVEPVPNEAIADSVGCGDVFSAATAWHFYRTNDILAAVRAGHKAARRKLLTPRQTTAPTR